MIALGNTPPTVDEVRARMVRRRERSRSAYQANPDKIREKIRARRQCIREDAYNASQDEAIKKAREKILAIKTTRP